MKVRIKKINSKDESKEQKECIEKDCFLIDIKRMNKCADRIINQHQNHQYQSHT